MSQLGKILIGAGALMLILGVILILSDRIPFLGKLPGDVSFRWGNTRVYFPIVTCLVISALLSIILGLFRK